MGILARLIMQYSINSQDIASYMQKDQAVCLKASTHVWHLRGDEEENGHVVKYMNYGEAVQHAQNALLYRMVGLPTVDSYALKNEHHDVAAISHVEEKENINGILAMPYLPGKPLSQYKKTMDVESRSELFRWLKENTLAACVIACHTDPNDTNIQCSEPDGELAIDFIDPEYALASTVEIPVEELFTELTTNQRRFPHYTGTDYDHDALIENTQQIIEYLQEQEMEQSADPEVSSYIPRMIERGEELKTILQKKGAFSRP